MGREDGLCRHCQISQTETGHYLVFDCSGSWRGMGWKWGLWIELDEKSKWAYEFEEGGKLRVGNQVEDMFT